MSIRFRSSIRLIIASAMLAAAPVLPSNAADVVAPGPYVAAQPDSLCAEDRNLKAIERRFRIQAREVHHTPDLTIVSITNFRQNRFLPITEDIRAVDRLYCQADAHMSDGHTRTLWYLVEYDEGFAGFGLAFGDNVEFCLSGLDRWNVYDGHCRVLR